MPLTITQKLSLLLIAALSLAACSGLSPAAPAPTAAPATHLTLSGSGGGTTILKSIVTPLQTEHPELTLEFLPGSGGGAAKKGVADGSLDLAILLSTDMSAEQQPGLELLSLAADPVAFVVHPDLTIKGLTTEQLKSIYSGQITNWSEVGGPDAPIIVLTRDEDEGSTKILRSTIFQDTPWAPSAIVFTKAGELREAVQQTPNSIGFGSYGDFVINGMSAKAIAVNNVSPKDYAGGSYVIPARTLALAYATSNKHKIQTLVDYLSSEAAKTALLSNGVVPVS